MAGPAGGRLDFRRNLNARRAAFARQPQGMRMSGRPESSVSLLQPQLGHRLADTHVISTPSGSGFSISGRCV